MSVGLYNKFSFKKENKHLAQTMHTMTRSLAACLNSPCFQAPQCPGQTVVFVCWQRRCGLFAPQPHSCFLSRLVLVLSLVNRQILLSPPTPRVHMRAGMQSKHYQSQNSANICLQASWCRGCMTTDVYPLLICSNFSTSDNRVDNFFLSAQSSPQMYFYITSEFSSVHRYSLEQNPVHRYILMVLLKELWL